MCDRAQDVHLIPVADERTSHVQRVRMILVEKQDALGGHGCAGVLLRDAERQSGRCLEEIEVAGGDVDVHVARP